MSSKILVIEDSESTGALLAMQLKNAGFDVLVVPDAMMGTREANRWRPDLVLLDLMLPAGGGQAVLRGMKQSVYTKNVPVIVLTGSTDEGLKKQALMAGANECLAKPHDHKLLIELIRKTLGIKDAPSA